MLKNKRNNKKNQRAKILKLFIYTFFCVVMTAVGAIFYIIQARRPLYISPIPKNFVLGAQLSEDKNINPIKNKLSELHIDYASIDKSQDSYLIKLKNKSEIIISSSKDVKTQLSSLQFILTRLTMEGKSFNQLDLRFDKPVIREEKL